MPASVRKPTRKSARAKRPSVIGRVLRWIAFAIVAFYLFIALSLISLRRFDPPTTAVQAQRRIQSWIHRQPYRKTYQPVPLDRISLYLQHSVIAAEDTRFYQHHGFDWKQIQTAVQDDLDEGRSRGASTITQQLVKNLFLTTNHSFIRKGIEFTIVPFAEAILGKRRILELYLNVIEWGPGIYGAQAAAGHWYQVTAAELTRDNSIQLASILPAPRRRHPGHTESYSARIAQRMREMKW